MKNKVVVLGAGMVGRAIAIDLAKKHNVVSADICDVSLKNWINLIILKQ